MKIIQKNDFVLLVIFHRHPVLVQVKPFGHAAVQFSFSAPVVSDFQSYNPFHFRSIVFFALDHYVASGLLLFICGMCIHPSFH